MQNKTDVPAPDTPGHSPGKRKMMRLRMRAGGSYAAPEDAYRFCWHGKVQAARQAQLPPEYALYPCREESVNWDTTQNLYLEGDNLEVLKLLKETRRGKIHTIYIDPPYNTGKDFVYADDYQVSRQTYLKKTGRAGAENRSGGAETGGRYHTDWLNMMYPRLLLARELLAATGVIFISIDDNELDNLKKICGEIFGEENYVNLITLKTKASSGASGGGEDKRLKKNTEYLLLYAKNRSKMKLRQPSELIPISDYIREHRANGVGFYYTRILEDEGEKELLCEQDGMKIYLHRNYRFSNISEKMRRDHLTEDEAYSRYFSRIFMVTNAQTSLLKKVNRATPASKMLVSYEYTPRSGRNRGVPTVKYVWNKTLVVWLSDSAEKNGEGVFKRAVLGTLWDDISWGRLDLQGGVPFKNGKKPLRLVERMLEMAAERDETVLDFFSGSATTAQAVMNCNARDGGSRRFILVQIPEPIDEQDEAYRAGYRDICEVGRDRIRKAGAAIAGQPDPCSPQLAFPEKPVSSVDIGFRVWKLGPLPETDGAADAGGKEGGERG